jgi:hypothetical protein
MHLAKSLLQWVQLLHVTVGGQPFDGGDFMPIGLYGEQNTGTHSLTVHQDGASAARTMFAADMCTGKIQVLAQEVAEQQTRLYGTFIFCAIDADEDKMQVVQ